MKLDHPSRTYTMPSGVPFLRCLAEGLAEHLGERLSDALILLPTRRAVRGLGDAFVEAGVLGRRATLLPRMRPLADIDTDDITFEPAALFADMSPAIPPLQRRFELARLAALYHQRASDIPVSAANAISLAEPLAAILDDAAMEESHLPDHDKLEEMRARSAEHFQHTSVFYEVLRTFWPERLRELGLMDPKVRQVAMLDALRIQWETEPPDYPVIVAGSTGTLAATRRLIAQVRKLPQGLVVLPGVDLNLRQDAAWDSIDLQHPQSSLKVLLEEMGVERGDIHNWPRAGAHEDAQMRARRRIISEALVPVSAAQDWPARIAKMKTSGLDFAGAVDGLSLIEARHDEEEALAIALVMREVLEDSTQTAALVTPDSGLARRVRTRLARWGVDVDFSQGQPLEETSLGAWLVGLVKLATDPGSPVDLAYLAKHRLTGLGQEDGAVREAWLKVERKFRGRRPDEGERSQYACVRQLSTALQQLTDIETAKPDGWARALVRTAETVAATDAASGAERLWAGEAGEAAASLLEDIIQFGDLLDPIDADGFRALLLGLMKERVVRIARGTHPRLSILGPLEARMLSADVLILGGLNEGTWPAIPAPTPYLSREMRTELGLSLPERRFGLSAHDFAQAASHKRVVLTRSERTSEGPAVASRWLWRLKTLLRGALGDGWEDAVATQSPYLDWARRMDVCPPEEVETIKAPAPTPPVEARWPQGRKLSVTQIRTWVRDPYSIYARHVLGLKPLDPLDVGTEARDWGTMIHDALETFFNRFPDELPVHAADELSLTLETKLTEFGFPVTELARERPRMRRMAVKVVDWARKRRSEGWRLVGSEMVGRAHFADMDFELTTHADHIEAGPAGYGVVDFKTGQPPTVKVVEAGFDLQLPLTALILKEGRMTPKGDAEAPIAAGPTTDMMYGRVRGTDDADLATDIVNSGKLNAEEMTQLARDTLKALVAEFDKPETAYHSQPRRQYTNDWGDYDHLARRGEWAVAGDDPDTYGGGGNG